MRCLQALGAMLKSNLRHEDIACRYGGEEFVLVLVGASLEDTEMRAEDLRVRATRLVVADQGRSLGQVSISVGVSAFPAHGSSADLLIRAADAALYEAKRSGRNRVVVAGQGAESNGAAPGAPPVLSIGGES